jgi:hypothetical protein
MYDIGLLRPRSLIADPGRAPRLCADAARWAHVLRAMGVACGPEDRPACHHLLPDFGDGAGTSFFCGPYTRDTWPPGYVVPACALVASGPRARVVLLGDIMSSRPDLATIVRPTDDYWWLEAPFSRWPQDELGFRRTRRGGHVAVLASRGPAPRR